MLLFMCLYVIIMFKFLAFQLKREFYLMRQRESFYLLEPVVVLLTKFSWQAEFQLTDKNLKSCKAAVSKSLIRYLREYNHSEYL